MSQDLNLELLDVASMNQVSDSIGVLRERLLKLLGDKTNTCLESLNSNIRGEEANNLLKSYIDKISAINDKIQSSLNLMDEFVVKQINSYTTTFSQFNEQASQIVTALDDLFNTGSANIVNANDPVKPGSNIGVFDASNPLDSN